MGGSEGQGGWRSFLLKSLKARYLPARLTTYRMLNSSTSPERARLAGEVVNAPVRGQMDTDHIRERPICCENF